MFISASCTAIILLLWLHPLCHLSPRVPFTGLHQIFIASLFFNKLSTPLSHSLHSSSCWFPFTGEESSRLGIHGSDDSSSPSFQPPNFSWTVPSDFITVKTLISTFPLYCHSVRSLHASPHPPPSLLTFSPSHALVPNPPPPCMLKYSVNEGSRGGSGGERAARRGGIGGGGNMDVRSAAVVMIFCSLFLGTSGPLQATVSSTVFTGSWREEQDRFDPLTRICRIHVSGQKLGPLRNRVSNNTQCITSCHGYIGQGKLHLTWVC